MATIRHYFRFPDRGVQHRPEPDRAIEDLLQRAEAGDSSARGRNDRTGSEQDSGRSQESLFLHRRSHRRSRRESSEVDSPAQHLEYRRGHSGERGDGEGIFRPARMPADPRVRRGHHRVRYAGKSGGLRQVRRRRAADAGHLLDVRHDADHGAGRLEESSVRSEAGGTGPLQESADRPRRNQF